MRRFLVERAMPGIGSADELELQTIAARGTASARQLGPDVFWLESFIGQDKTYCLYLAKDAELVRRHSALAGFPADRISEVSAILDPTIAKT